MTNYERVKTKVEASSIEQSDKEQIISLFADVADENLTEIANLFDEKPEDEEEITGQSYNEVFNIIVECKDEAEQEKIFNRLDSEGYKCRVQSL